MGIDHLTKEAGNLWGELPAERARHDPLDARDFVHFLFDVSGQNEVTLPVTVDLHQEGFDEVHGDVPLARSAGRFISDRQIP